MKTLTITGISKHFDAKLSYLQNPPKKSDLQQVLNYIEQNNYNQLLFDYGETYCLVVLDMFEKLEMYEICQEILTQIETHNAVSGTDFKTSLAQLD